MIAEYEERETKKKALSSLLAQFISSHIWRYLIIRDKTKKQPLYNMFYCHIYITWRFYDMDVLSTIVHALNYLTSLAQCKIYLWSNCLLNYKPMTANGT